MEGKSIRRTPVAVLRPFVKLLWAADERVPEGPLPIRRERLLPSGSMHLVFRLCDSPIRIFESVADPRGTTFHHGVIGGLRAGFYVKELSSPVRTVGAMLETGVARALFGAEAHELAERHTPVEDVWGLEARYLWEQLREAKTLETQLDHFEVFLARKLPQVHGMHPAIAHALSRFPSTTNIGGIVDETGYSHRRFIELFRRTVGLPPRLFTRVLRFQRALKSIAGKSRVSWIDLALEAGYSDQAHFNREFREFSGVSPTEYLKLTDGESLHVPILSKARGR